MRTRVGARPNRDITGQWFVCNDPDNYVKHVCRNGALYQIVVRPGQKIDLYQISNMDITKGKDGTVVIRLRECKYIPTGENTLASRRKLISLGLLSEQEVDNYYMRSTTNKLNTLPLLKILPR